MATKHERIAHQQQLTPYTGHTHVHAADVRQETDLALGLQRVMSPSNAPCAPRHAFPRHWQSVGLFAWMACPCHFRCVPPRFGACPLVRPHRLASGPLSNVLQSVHGPAQTRALVRHRLGEWRGWPRTRLINQPSKAPPDPKSKWQPLCQKSPRLPSTQDSLSPWRKPKFLVL